MPNDTIAAIATPLAQGALATIRLSGPDARSIASRVFRPASERSLETLPGYAALYGRVHDREGDIDECILLNFRAPKSYTGEDVVELSCHGGIAVTERLLAAIIDAGARPAGPGEYTRRAFLHGKMDLTQAEAVASLIGASSRSAAEAALAMRDGALYRRIRPAADRLIGIEAALSAWVDFPDDETPEITEEEMALTLRDVLADLRDLIDHFEQGKLVRDGIDTAIVGPPNVGKSTLMNALSGTGRSIVTPIAGTTRDVVEERITLHSLTLNLADTAGIRETEDPIEREGVLRSQKRMDTAHLILAVFDQSQPLDPDADKLLCALKGRPCVAVVNKSDLPPVLDLAVIRDAIPHTVVLSAKTGEGLPALGDAIKAVVGLGDFDPQQGVLQNMRQRSCVLQAIQSVEEALAACEAGITFDAVGVLIDEAIAALLSLTGERVDEAVIDRVFHDFCVGK